MSYYRPFWLILIESQWNLNAPAFLTGWAETFNINRITVKFKCSHPVLVSSVDFCILIESQWNLNIEAIEEVLDWEEILIESQWNLNLPLNNFLCNFSHILIESQWNLNYNGRNCK